MTKKALYKIEIENSKGEVFESFNSLEDYHNYVSDLAVEAWDSRDELDSKELFDFMTWFIVIDNNGDFRSLTSEQFKAQA